LQGGQGFVKNILYEDITLINANFPIIIDQQYRDNAGQYKQSAGVIFLNLQSYFNT